MKFPRSIRKKIEKRFSVKLSKDEVNKGEFYLKGYEGSDISVWMYSRSIVVVSAQRSGEPLRYVDALTTSRGLANVLSKV